MPRTYPESSGKRRKFPGCRSCETKRGRPENPESVGLALLSFGSRATKAVPEAETQGSYVLATTHRPWLGKGVVGPQVVACTSKSCVPRHAGSCECLNIEGQSKKVQRSKEKGGKRQTQRKKGK
ncbi:hypothetical protein MC885_002831 [Smutsia gigantea]|nr:hypothetical protein MC885_002831 [Smutsia gigantea]